MLCKAGNQGGF